MEQPKTALEFLSQFQGNAEPGTFNRAEVETAMRLYAEHVAAHQCKKTRQAIDCLMRIGNDGDTEDANRDIMNLQTIKISGEAPNEDAHEITFVDYPDIIGTRILGKSNGAALFHSMRKLIDEPGAKFIFGKETNL
jgi:hypothetical protein